MTGLMTSEAPQWRHHCQHHQCRYQWDDYCVMSCHVTSWISIVPMAPMRHGKLIGGHFCKSLFTTK